MNAYEAEGRRLARFFRTGHTPGRVETRAEPRNPNFPFTLDLRALNLGVLISLARCPASCSAEYPLTHDRYDELFEAPHTPRAHWKPVIEQLAAWPAERMRERLHSVQSQVRENGVTYNVYADPQGADRPWELDLLPMILPQEEWSADRGGDRAARHAR